MRRWRSLGIAGAALAMILALAGCSTVPLNDPPPLPGSGSSEMNRTAILRGMAKHGWERVSEAPGVVIAQLVVRSHVAVVKISYDTDSILIAYDDSDGLSCVKTETSCSEIHRAYNRWVVQLRKDIASEISHAELPYE